MEGTCKTCGYPLKGGVCPHCNAAKMKPKGKKSPLPKRAPKPKGNGKRMPRKV